MNVVERVREIGVLRATGMTRRQVWRTVVVEAGILGVVGAILGIAPGSSSAALMVALAGGGIDVGLDVPWPTIGVALVLGVASRCSPRPIRPAWRARLSDRPGRPVRVTALLDSAPRRAPSRPSAAESR